MAYPPPEASVCVNNTFHAPETFVKQSHQFWQSVQCSMTDHQLVSARFLCQKTVSPNALFFLLLLFSLSCNFKDVLVSILARRNVVTSDSLIFLVVLSKMGIFCLLLFFDCWCQDTCKPWKRVPPLHFFPGELLTCPHLWANSRLFSLHTGGWCSYL